MMGKLPPVSQRVYTTQNQKLFVASGEERDIFFADAAAELRKDVSEDQALDITVTCDGTWARREFQSLYGVVVVASWNMESAGCGSTEQALPGLCHTPWNGYFL